MNNVMATHSTPTPPPRHFRRLTLVDGDIKAWTAAQALTSPTRVVPSAGATRRQGSISYTSSPSTPSSTVESTPDVPELLGRSSSFSGASAMIAPDTNISPGKRRPRPLSLAISSNKQSPESPIQSPPLTLAETYAPLLHFIAQKESKCLELRSQLAQHESELAILKRKWEKIVSRERAYGHRSNASRAPSTLDYPKSKFPSNASTTSSSSASTNSRSSLDSLLSASPDSSFDGDSAPSSSPSPCQSPAPSLAPNSTVHRPSASPLSSLFTPLSNFTSMNIDNAVDKILNPSNHISSALANVNLSNAMDKLMSPRQQRRASKVLEGVINWSAAALNSNNTRPPSPLSRVSDMPDDAFTSSPSAFLTAIPSPVPTSVPLIDEEPEKETKKEIAKEAEDDEDGWNW